MTATIDAAIILGSGLAGVFDDDELEVVGTLATSVAGHRGALALWRFEGSTLLVSLGRRHLYEGIDVRDVTGTVELAAARGARRLVVTNAAGGLNPHHRVGDIMLITGLNALMLGRQLRSQHGADEWNQAATPFDHTAQHSVLARALDSGVRLQQGTYAAVLGPSYETRAEIRMLRLMGADAVGMSTVPEIVAARRLGLRVTGLSLITNTLSDTSRQALDHADVVVAGERSQRAMRMAIEAALLAD